MDDGELIRRAREGDDTAFEAFVDRYKNPLVNYLTHLTRSRDRAEEFAQDAFVRFYRNLSKCRDEERLGPYLFRIASNIAISQVRREQRWQQLLPFVTAFQQRTPPPADAPLLADETQRRVAAALAALPVTYRAPLVLYEIEEWSYEEIASALGCRIGTVKSRIFRARGLMRRQLEAWWRGENHGKHWRDHETPAEDGGVASIHA